MHPAMPCSDNHPVPSSPGIPTSVTVRGLTSGPLWLLFLVLVGMREVPCARPAEPNSALVVTNITQLYRLDPATTAAGLAIRIRGVVTYADLPWSSLFLEDASIGMHIATAGLTNEPAPGDFVELQAVTAVEDQITVAKQPRLVVLEHRSLPKPRDVTEQALMSGASSALLVQTTGVVRAVEARVNRLRFEMLVGKLRVPCFVKHLPVPDFDPDSLVGASVRVQGVCANRYRGRKIEGASLFIADLSQVRVLNQSNPPRLATPVTPIHDIVASPDSWDRSKRVRVQATVVTRRGATGSNPASALVRDPTGSINIFCDASTSLNLDERLDVWGFPGLQDAQVVLEDAVCANPSNPTNAPPDSTGQPAPFAAAPPILKIGDVRKLSRTEASLHLPVNLQGTVTYADQLGRYLFLQDATGALFVRTAAEGVSLGDLVQVTGITDPGGIARMVSEGRVTILGKTNLPQPLRLDLTALLSETYDCYWSELEGVVHASEDGTPPTLSLVGLQGRFKAMVNGVGATAAPLRKLIDARVRLRGVSTPELNSLDRLVEPQLRVPDPSLIEVLDAAPNNPYDLPITVVSALVKSGTDLLGLHRRHVRGTVTLLAPGQDFCIQDTTGAIWVRAAQTNSVHLNDTLDVVGFPSLNRQAQFLVEALFTPAQEKLVIPPARVAAQRLLEAPYRHRLVQLDARLLNDAGGSLGPSLLLQSGTQVFQAQFETGNRTAKVPLWKAGSVLRVTGICDIQMSDRGDAHSFNILLRSPEDVAVLSRPPWWTARYAAMLGTGLILLAVAATGWAALLRKQVRERTAQIRERIESEAAVARRLALVWETSADGMRVTDRDGIVLQVNEAYCRMMRKPREQLEGAPFSSVYLEPARESVLASYRQAFARREAPPRLELDVSRWDGQSICLEIATAFLAQPGGETLLLAQLRDVTERKRAETQLSQARKIESIGRLAGGVAHDFNNMLQVILGHTALALEQAPPTSHLHDNLLEIQKSAQRSAALTRQLLAFARKQPVTPRLLDLNDTVAGMLNMLRRLIGENIRLSWVPGAELWPVRFDPTQIDQILANLVVNARDAIGGTGEVSIETANDTLEATSANRPADCPPGRYVTLSVRDNGRGMTPETRDHIFEPFFTTKSMGEGTGLGLATVFGIVKQNSGAIQVLSEQDRGTTFKIYIPRSDGTASRDTSTAEPKPRGGTETVLFVEDELQILELGRRILAQTGYNVLATTSPEEALRIASLHRGPIHLLLTDVVMPGMSGKELCERLAPTQKGMRCLYISGYTADRIAHQGLIDQSIHFLEKPFTITTLARKVREVLDDPQPSPPAQRPATRPGAPAGFT